MGIWLREEAQAAGRLDDKTGAEAGGEAVSTSPGDRPFRPVCS